MTFAVAFLLAFLVGGSATSIADAQQPSPAVILARAKAAAGGAAVDKLHTLHLQEGVQVLGISGEGEEWDDLLTGRFASSQSAGPVSSGDGFDGAIVWSQDATGLAHPTGGAEDVAVALSQAYFVSLGFWYPERFARILSSAGAPPAIREGASAPPTVKSVTEKGKRYFVVSVTAGEIPAEIWIDATTYLIGRDVIHASPDRSARIDFSDYRKVNGAMIPFVTQLQDSQGNSFTTTVTRAEPNVSVEGRFTMPSATPDDFSMATGTTSTTFPIELVNNHIFLDAKVNGQGPFRFIFDTGGQGILNPDVAQKLGITPAGTMQAGGAGAGTVQTGFAWVPKVELGGATMTHQSFAVLPLGGVMGAVEGVHIDGMVGWETAARYIMSIDYAHKTMTLTMPGPGIKPAGTSVPFVFVQTVPQVNGVVDGLPGLFIVDTGNRNALVLYTPFVDKNGLRAKYSPKVAGVAGYGIGGPTTAQLTRVASVQIGGVDVPNVVTGLSQDITGALADPYISGNVGGGLLGRFTVTFDYRNRVIYLAKNADFDQSPVGDRSGLVLVAARSGIKAIGVLSNTPAAEAGIQAGDVIVTVNGTPAGDMGLLAIRSLFHGPLGTAVKLTVSTGSTTRDVTLTLRDYV
jgi:hypothetical protein